jgi:GNAT superfamily N-acetyltransferase
VSGYFPPTPLAPEHVIDTFDSGVPPLDRWLRERARKNESAGASRTYVTTSSGTLEVVGFYSLATSSVRAAHAPGAVRRNMPDPVPVILLGRLAVDRGHQGAGLGASLLQDALLRVVQAADIVGIRALLVHAIDETAARFYRRHGFVPSPFDDQTLFLPLATIRAALDA